MGFLKPSVAHEMAQLREENLRLRAELAGKEGHVQALEAINAARQVQIEELRVELRERRSAEDALLAQFVALAGARSASQLAPVRMKTVEERVEEERERRELAEKQVPKRLSKQSLDAKTQERELVMLGMMAKDAYEKRWGKYDENGHS
jgi:predicted aconitase